MIAAGGGGDAITAAAIGPFLGLTDEHPVVMTYAWERLIIDPLPGPRSTTQFTGLRELAPNVLEVTPATRATPPAGSTLPRLAAELPSRLILLDPHGGASGMATQIRATARYFRADRLALVDVGGDVITDGTEEGLRSPLGDLLAIAACNLADLPSHVFVSGPGLDGELSEQVVLDRISRLHGQRVQDLTALAFSPVQRVFQWHPSEASGLLSATASGARGLVEVRDSGAAIKLSDDALRIFIIDLGEAARAGPALDLKYTTSFNEARQVIEKITGVSEVSYETMKARRLLRAKSRQVSKSDLVRLDALADEANTRGVSYVSLRRLSELLGVHTSAHLARFHELLNAERGRRYMPPLYEVTKAK